MIDKILHVGPKADFTTIFNQRKENMMPFTIDENNLLMKGRRGDSATITLEFETPLNGLCLDFYIKKNLNIPDEDSVIKKTYENIRSNIVNLSLTSKETQMLETKTDSYTRYYWGLRLHNKAGYAQTLIPVDCKAAPMLHVYPRIGGCIDG